MGGYITPRPGRFTPGKETRYPLYRRLGGSRGPSGLLRKMSPRTGIRSPDRQARIKSLYPEKEDIPEWVCTNSVRSMSYCLKNTIWSWRTGHWAVRGFRDCCQHFQANPGLARRLPAMTCEPFYFKLMSLPTVHNWTVISGGARLRRAGRAITMVGPWQKLWT